ncbi:MULTISPECIES: hypothetical protein [Streptomyces]|uniref:hypothetical protein n=1 Tax=Streptomyces TaxID=1883 RepID=UPI0016763377|nr:MULTISPECIES: hypothetical protein [Streptomyces]MBD3574683.1 hypothetical protein [Streptomyces sp. KD18]
MSSHHDSPAAEAPQDPAADTQMFRAFVEEGASGRRAAERPAEGGGNLAALAAGFAAVLAAALWIVLR